MLPTPSTSDAFKPQQRATQLAEIKMRSPLLQRPIHSRFVMATACLAVFGTIACSPTFNWREVPIAATPLSALFPCKPEKESRTVTMGGRSTELHMAHCDTAGVTVAVGHASVADVDLVRLVLTQWRDATLATMRLTTSGPTGSINGPIAALPGALGVEAKGIAANGEPLRLKAIWFAHEGEVYAALWYGQAWSDDVADSFFGGLRVR